MSSSVIVALRIKAAPARVFEVFTREIALWWTPHMLFELTPRGDGVLRFEGEAGGRLVTVLDNGKVFEIGRIKEWKPGESLVFGWRQATFPPDVETEVCVRFEAVGNETRVTIEHRGWDAVPDDHLAKHRFPEQAFLMRQGEHWRALLAGLAARANHQD